MCDDVIDGLSRNPKMIPAKYLYDECGINLFDQIYKFEEYYPPANRNEHPVRQYRPDHEFRRPLFSPHSGGPKKDTDILEATLNDSNGISVAVALIGLVRFNRELDANFDRG